MEPAPPTSAEQTCYRHKDRRAGVRCQRCERPICPQCMHTASVGFHCPECTKTGKQKVYTRANLDRAPGMRPLVTQVLMVANVGVFVAGIIADRRLDVPTDVNNPILDGSLDFLLRGGLNGPIVADGEWWRILTSGFLHFGIIHLAFNLFALFQIGQILERMLGRLRLIAAYLTSLVFGSLGAIIVEPDGLTAGASGAIFGLFGVMFLAARARGIDPWASGIAMTLGINLLITFGIPGISIGGHVGGLVGGLVCGFVLFDLGPKRLRGAAQEVALIVALGGAAFAAALLVASGSG